MLRQLNIKHTYQQPNDNIAEDFYNQTLMVADRYDRVSGYFSSKSLLQYIVGLKGLIHNSGKMRLVISNQIPEEDYKAIINGYEKRDYYLEKLKKEISPENNIEDYDSFSLLSYLISRDKLDIRVGFCSTGIFHSKFGIIKDANDNKIMFMGSHNETGAGINGNYEMFNVTASWLASEFDQRKITDAEQEFDRLWNDSHNGVVIVKEFSEVIKSELRLYNPSRAITKEGDFLPNENNTILLTKDKEVVLKHINLTKTINTESFDFIFHLNRFFEDEKYPVFKKNTSHIDIQEFIKVFSTFCEKESINFIVDRTVLKWLKEKNFFIEERMNYGNIIKSKDTQIMKRYKDFSEIVAKEMKRILRPQQMWSAFYMSEMKKTANFSVPGSGKTSMVYGAFSYLNSKELNKVDRIIMIGPKNSFEAWKEEFILNFGEMKKLFVLDIHDETKDAVIELTQNYLDYNLILVNYESLPKYEYELNNIIDSKTMLVFDEVHRIKAIDGVRATSSMKISLNANYKYVLTGTPIPNGYIDVYNFLNILFDHDYRDFFEWTPKDLLNLPNYEILEINKKLAPFYWRTTKSELNVPPPNPDNFIEVTATVEEQEIIDMLYRKFRHNPLLLYIRLMQMSSNPSLLLEKANKENLFDLELFEGFDLDLLDLIVDDKSFSEKEQELIRKVGKTGKYYAGLDKIEELVSRGEKVVVWCVFVGTISSVLQDINQRGIKAVAVHGSVENRDRTNIIKNFKEGDSQVLVTNPHTLGEAISLHHSCHNAIYMEYTFNLTHMLQSRDRIHRLGLHDHQETNYYYTMLRGTNLDTIDYKIYLRLEEKASLMLQAIEGDYLQPMPSETIKDMIDLFSDLA